MKKNIGHILGAVAELLLVTGAFAVKYFTGKKMGMARFVIFKNQAWEKAYPLEQWKLISIVVLILLLALTVFLLIRKRGQLTGCLLAESVIMAALALFSLHFTLTNSVAALRPYYWMSPMFAAAALVQIVRTLILLLNLK